ncbi:Arc family DNA-binding protein [Xanthomonas sp. CFBP 8445]|uniref:Arc family DNA-binding protein n=1 Tax=Xanthomonas sp. CFBP 8445 TaxID=2971236 RepID=UPI0021DFBD01|nr:Arc family DNA-binding protein [Xanthomonas sp. CFBP 8445]UYC12860.1 Arc family DNA-binding protein [Xanthomonas sp. CFBP 8445]
MAVNDPHFKIRLPADLKAQLEKAAEENGRSVTAEIVHRLRRYEDIDAAGLEALVRVSVKKIEELQELIDSLDLPARLGKEKP